MFVVVNGNMSLSPVQSNSKCGSSDFSIERILGEESKTIEKCPKTPSWLCCTRYQPPRIPRVVGGGRARRSGRHARVPFTGAQAAALEAAYARAPYLAPPALRALAAALQLRDDRIKIWFQNRRARERRQKSCSITPPHAVTLPSSSKIHRSNQNETWVTLQQQVKYPYDNITEQTHGASAHKFDAATSSTSYVWRSISSSEDSNESRCESPLDVETVD